VLAGRKTGLSKIYDKYSDVKQYASWDSELGEVQLNTALIEALEDSADTAL
jgi:hypothetical protein